MLLPRYFFSNEFTEFRDFFEKRAAAKRQYTAGSFLSPPGEPLNTVMYILSGKTKVSIDHENGKQHIAMFFGENSIFPLRCDDDLFALEANILFSAVTDCTVLELSPGTFSQMIIEQPRLGIAGLDHYCKYANLLLYICTSSAAENALTRTCNFLYLYGLQDAECKDSLPYSQSEIADIVGISRMQISRIYSNLKERNIIATESKGVRILDREKLLGYCSEFYRL